MSGDEGRIGSRSLNAARDGINPLATSVSVQARLETGACGTSGEAVYRGLWR